MQEANFIENSQGTKASLNEISSTNNYFQRKCSSYFQLDLLVQQECVISPSKKNYFIIK